jgi:hypothetical protein
VSRLPQARDSFEGARERPDRHHDGLEPVTAWGKPVLLDLRYSAAPADESAPTLVALGAALIGTYHQVRAIFA